MTKSKNPAYPDADPTAPGGMSRKELAAELVRTHGWTKEEVAEKFGALSSWPLMIEAVIHERKYRERAAASASLEQPAPLFIGMPDTKDYIFDGHAGASPSGSERWLSCTASLGASRAFLETLSPNQQAEFAKSGVAARQGTTAHAVAEAEARVMLGEMDEGELVLTLQELSILPETEGEAYSDEMAEYVVEYTDLIQSYINDGYEVLIEHRVTATVELTTVDAEGEYDLHQIIGSADCIAVPTKELPVLRVVDLKYGEGIEVEPEDNSQAKIYALGAIEEIYERLGELPDWLNDVEITIAQPRLGGIKTWMTTVDDLFTWRDEVVGPALTEALAGVKGGAAFRPSDVACQWCPARGSCPALAQHTIEQGKELFDVIQATEFETGIEGAFPETETLTGEELARYYSQARAVADLAKAMKAEVDRRLQRGMHVPGYHLVNYTPPRKWHEEAVEELDPANGAHGVLPPDVAAQLWTEKLVTPTMAEKILGDDYERIKHVVDKPAIRPVGAPENDRRKPWVGRPPEQMFEVEE